MKPSIGKDVSESHVAYYQIYDDALTKLQYARIGAAGLEIIAARYNDDERYRAYNVQIEIESYKYEEHYGLEDFNLKLRRKILSLRDGEAKGVVFVQQDYDAAGVFHAVPFMLARVQNKIIIIDFEEKLSEKIIIDDCEVVVKKCLNYSKFQKDRNSCSVFAINALKNSFLDREFMAQMIDLDSQSLLMKDAKEVIGQGGNFCVD